MPPGGTAGMEDPTAEHGREPRNGRPRPSRGLRPDEFARAFEEAARPLWTVAAGVLGSPAEAEDVLQEAALLALPKLDRFERGTSFLAWMGRFVRNVALNHVRKRARRGEERLRPGVLDELVAAPRRPARLPVEANGSLVEDQTAFDDRLLAELRELAPVPRACLLLRSVLELSYREIAELLEVPEGTAMSHVHRTRVRLRASLGDAAARPASDRVPEVETSR